MLVCAHELGHGIAAEAVTILSSGRRSFARTKVLETDLQFSMMPTKTSLLAALLGSAFLFGTSVEGQDTRTDSVAIRSVHRAQQIRIRGSAPTPQIVTVRPRIIPQYSRQVLSPTFFDRHFASALEAPAIVQISPNGELLPSSPSETIDISKIPGAADLSQMELLVADAALPPTSAIPLVFHGLQVGGWAFDPTIHRIGGNTFSITAYNEEPDTVDNRVRRIAFKILLEGRTGATRPSVCTRISVAWPVVDRSVRVRASSKAADGARPREDELAAIRSWFDRQPECPQVR